MGISRIGLLWGALLGLCWGCQSAGVFQCEADGDCSSGSFTGVCQDDGYCAFPTEACDSGLVYGEFAPPELAGTCVPGAAGSSDGSGSGGGEGTTTTATDSGGPDDSGSPSTGADPTTTGGTADEGLVLWLSFDDYGGERVVPDDSGNGHDAQCIDLCPDDAIGVVGDAVEFWSDDALFVPFDSDLVTPSALTVAVWVRVELLGRAGQAIVEMPYMARANPSWNSWELRLQDTDLDGVPSLFFAIANDQEQSVVELESPPLFEDEWAHLVGVWDGRTVRLYVDGVDWGEAPAAGASFDEQGIYIGAGLGPGGVDDELDGRLDELRVYSRALDPVEIQELYAQGD